MFYSIIPNVDWIKPKKGQMQKDVINETDTDKPQTRTLILSLGEKKLFYDQNVFSHFMDCYDIFKISWL